MGAGAKLIANLAVHFGLGKAGLIDLIMASTAITNQINQNVFAKGLLILHRQGEQLGHHLNIIALHMQNGNFKGHGYTAGIGKGSSVLRAGGKTNLVVGDDVQRPAAVVAGQTTQI